MTAAESRERSPTAHLLLPAAILGAIFSVAFCFLQSELDWNGDGKSNLQEYLASIDGNGDGKVSRTEMLSAAIVPVGVVTMGLISGLGLVAAMTFLLYLLESGQHMKRLLAMRNSSVFGESCDSEMAEYLQTEFSERRLSFGCERTVSDPTPLRRSAIVKKFQRAVSSARTLHRLAGAQPGKLHDLDTRIHQWNFNLFEVAEDTKQPLHMVGMICLNEKEYDFPEQFHIDRTRLGMFLSDVEDSYRDVPYHNSLHAASVARMVFSFLRDCGLDARLPADMQFTLVLAGLVHDVHHPGLTAAFLSQAGTPWECKIEAPLEEDDMSLALKYNDQSPLENMHCAITFQLLCKERNQFLPSDIIASLKPVLVRAILGTDMAKHAEAMTRLTMMLDNFSSSLSGIPWCWPNSPPGNLTQAAKDKWEANMTTGFIMELFLHAADIGTPCLPINQWREWNRRVTLEFHAQGDLELEQFGRLISPPQGFDRQATAKDQHIFTKGFMQFLSLPLFNKLAELTKVQKDMNIAYGVDISACLENLNSNIRHWEFNVPKDEDEDQMMRRNSSSGSMSASDSSPSTMARERKNTRHKTIA